MRYFLKHYVIRLIDYSIKISNSANKILVLIFSQVRIISYHTIKLFLVACGTSSGVSLPRSTASRCAPVVLY